MTSESEKICILLKSVGNAPVLKKDKFMLGKTTKLSYVINFLSKKMCEPDERIFIYIHQSFSPTPDTSVGLLFDNYSSDGKLVLHYSKSPAWG